MPSTTNLPCYYYPTAVVIVDDNEKFLTNLSLTLDTKLAYALFNQPSEAFEYITRQSCQSPKENLLIEDLEAETYGLNTSQLQTKVDLSNIYREIYDAKRFNLPSVLVVDYSMPNMSGHELCEKLKNIPIKKIMLTGEADDSLAVKLFNEGIIDKFISKKEANSGNKVDELIKKLQLEYFLDKTHTLLENLKTQSSFHLKDKVVNNIFNETCHKYNIAEYYMISANGAFFLLSFDGTPYIFFVIDEKELHDYREVAKDHKAPQAVLKQLKEGKKIPFFPSEREFIKAEGCEWEKYLYPAKKVVGDKIYYCAIISEKEPLAIKHKEIKSYKYFLENEWSPTT